MEWLKLVACMEKMKKPYTFVVKKLQPERLLQRENI